MNQALIQRYQPGGDIFAELAADYGADAANNIARVARTANREAVTESVTLLRSGPKLETSTAKIFVHQITTDPFAAPLETANRGLGNVFGSAIKGLFANPWVLVTVVIAGALYFLGPERLLKLLKR